jgi:hypothetical protein
MVVRPGLQEEIFGDEPIDGISEKGEDAHLPGKDAGGIVGAQEQMSLDQLDAIEKGRVDMPQHRVVGVPVDGQDFMGFEIVLDHRIDGRSGGAGDVQEEKGGLHGAHRFRTTDGLQGCLRYADAGEEKQGGKANPAEGCGKTATAGPTPGAGASEVLHQEAEDHPARNFAHQDVVRIQNGYGVGPSLHDQPVGLDEKIVGPGRREADVHDAADLRVRDGRQVAPQGPQQVVAALDFSLQAGRDDRIGHDHVQEIEDGDHAQKPAVLVHHVVLREVLVMPLYQMSTWPIWAWGLTLIRLVRMRSETFIAYRRVRVEGAAACVPKEAGQPGMAESAIFHTKHTPNFDIFEGV